jgi:hypothetical protein
MKFEQIELARHPRGFVLYARPARQLKQPWLGLNLMCPGPVVHRLSWNPEKRQLGGTRANRLLLELPDDVYNWLTASLENYAGEHQ